MMLILWACGGHSGGTSGAAPTGRGIAGAGAAASSGVDRFRSLIASSLQLRVEPVPDVGSEGCELRNSRRCTSHIVSADSSTDYIVTLSARDTDIVPGAVVSAESVRSGTPRTIELPRSRVVLSAEFMGRHISETIDTPTLDHLKDGTSKILRAAMNEMVNGRSSRAPLLAQYSFHAANSQEEALSSLGVAGKFDNGVLRVSLGLSIGNSRKDESASVIAEYTQPVITISAQVEGDSIIAPSIGTAQIDELSRRHEFSPNNQPILIHSVVYGRYALGRIESTQSVSSRALAASLSAAYAGVFALDAAAIDQWKNTLRTLSRRYVFNGGSVSNAQDFVRALDVGDILSIPPIEAIVPIGFSMSTTAIPWTTISIQTLRQFMITECLPPGTSYTTQNIDFVVDAHTGALNTGVRIDPTDQLTVVATGNIWTGYLLIGCNGPDGLGQLSNNSAYPMPNGKDSALIGRIGSGALFHIGSGAGLTPIIPAAGGTLILGVNDNDLSNGDECKSAPPNLRNFRVHLSITRSQVTPCP